MPYILLVEDNSSNRMVIQDIVEFDDVPAELVWVETGEEAVAKAVQFMPELILLDIQLPGISGIETAKALKADRRTQHIPIWAVTAQAMVGAEEEALLAGFQRYVTKPVDSARLAQELIWAVSTSREVLTTGAPMARSQAMYHRHNFNTTTK